MKVIYKYQLSIGNKMDIPMPLFAKVLTVQVQREVPYIWALVDTENPIVPKTFRIATLSAG